MVELEIPQVNQELRKGGVVCLVRRDRVRPDVAAV